MFFKALWSVCRCTLLFITLVIGLIAAWVSWNIPDAARFQSEMQRVLQHELQLGQLDVAPLRWQWSLHPALTAEYINFSSLDGRIRVQDAVLHAHISLTGLLLGRLNPADVRIEGGHLYAKLDSPANSRSINNSSNSETSVSPDTIKTGLPVFPALPPFRLRILNTDIDWEYAGMQGKLRKVSVDINGGMRRLSITSTAIDAYVLWNNKQEMNMLRLQLHNAVVLPDVWQDFIQLVTPQSLAGELHIIKQTDNRWKMQFSLWATDNSQIIVKDNIGEETLAFQRITTDSILSIDAIDSSLQDIYCLAIRYENNYHNKNYHADGKIHWDGKILHASVSDGVFPLHPVWHWLKPIADTNEWHAWLAAMKHGSSRDITAALHLPWQNLQQVPDAIAWQAAAFDVHASISAADIALDDAGTLLTDVSGRLHIDNYSLHAKINKAILPKGVGILHKGKLSIENWDSIALAISGKGEIDIERLRRWLDIPRANEDFILNRAPAKGRFALLWMADEALPRSGKATLRPQGRWRAIFNGQSLNLSDGILRWKHNKHLLIEDMYANTALMSAIVNMRVVAVDGSDTWKMASINLKAKGDVATLVKKLELPLQQAQGIWYADIQGDEQHLLAAIDASDAGWQRLLGSEKKVGIPYKLNARLDNDHAQDTGLIWQLSSTMLPLRLTARGEQKSNGSQYIKLNDVYSQSFIGNMTIILPKTNKTVRIKLAAKYIGDAMLPDGPKNTNSNNSNQDAINSKKQNWEITGEVQRLHYGRLLAKNVEFKLDSNGELGYISMQHLHVSHRTELHDIDARVRLLGTQEGVRIERMEMQGVEQLIRLSATVKQQQSGRWQWRGTMKMEGKFAPLVSLVDANQHFIGGILLAQFEGRGVFVRGKPWWDDVDGNLEIKVKKGRVQDGGTMSRLLSLTSLVDIPRLLLLQRHELFGDGMYYEQLRFQSHLRGKIMHIDKMAMRAPAMDLVGFGTLDMSNAAADLIIVIRPFQNIDKLIGSIPIIRDIIGGAARSIMRKVFHVHGRLSDAVIEKISFKDAGLEQPGLLEGLLSLPGLWFDAIAGSTKTTTKTKTENNSNNEQK